MHQFSGQNVNGTSLSTHKNGDIHTCIYLPFVQSEHELNSVGPEATSFVKLLIIYRTQHKENPAPRQKVNK